MMDVPTCCDHLLIHKDSEPQITCFCRKTSSEEQETSKLKDVQRIEQSQDISDHGHSSNCNIIVSEDNSSTSNSLHGLPSHSNKVVVSDNRNCIVDSGRNMRQVVDEDHKPYPGCQLLGHFLEDKPVDYFNKFLLSDKELKRFVIMDIANSCLRKTTCFTKR